MGDNGGDHRVSFGRSARPAAERQRRYRQRQKLGLRVVNIELGEADIARLIDVGLLQESDGIDGHAVSNAVERLVEALGDANE